MNIRKYSHFANRRNLLLGAAGMGIAGITAGIGAAMAARAMWNSFTGVDLRGKVVLITGGSRGLGLALAQEFAREGCKLAICARNEHQLDHAVRILRQQEAKVIAFPCDVTNHDNVLDMVQKITDVFGHIDILVNNAGTIQVGPIESQTISDFREAMDVMFWAQVYTSMAVLPQMQERHAGHIVNISSIGGKIAVPHLVPYSSAKFAAVGFSEGLSAEVAKDGIKVITVCPGLMRTGSHINAQFKGNYRSEYAWFSLGASSPLTAISARRAARSIVNAVKQEKTEVVLSVPAKAAALIHGIFPGVTTRILGLANRVIPGKGAASKERHIGEESKSRISESALTVLGRRAANEFNQRLAS